MTHLYDAVCQISGETVYSNDANIRFTAYKCGNGIVWSSVYQFTAKRTDPDWSPSIVMYGDMGSTNARSLIALQEETNKGYYDAVFHVGKIISLF